MELIQTIRAKIERLKDENKKIKCPANERYCSGYDDAFYDLLSFLDTLQEQDRPEPYNPTYDEAYLNEKITKASKTWKGVDVDKYMNEVRGRESEKPINQEGLEEEITRTYHDGSVADTSDLDHNSYENIARHFAQWGAEHRGSSETPNDLKEAVKNYIYKAADSPGDDWTTDDIRKAYIAGYKLHEANTPLPEDTVLFNKGVAEGKRLMMEEAVEGVLVDNADGTQEICLHGNRYGDKVRVIILPKEDEK